MTTTGARLVALSGGGSAGSRLAALAPGPAAGTRLVNRSGLPTATAAVHLMYDPTGPGGDGAVFVGMILNLGTLLLRK